MRECTEVVINDVKSVVCFNFGGWWVGVRRDEFGASDDALI